MSIVVRYYPQGFSQIHLDLFPRAIKDFANQPRILVREANLHRFSASFRPSADVCTQSTFKFPSRKGRIETSRSARIAEEFSAKAQIMRTRTPLGVSAIRVPPTGFLFCPQFVELGGQRLIPIIVSQLSY
jgi:hypothetical protein